MFFVSNQNRFRSLPSAILQHQFARNDNSIAQLQSVGQGAAADDRRATSGSGDGDGHDNNCSSSSSNDNDDDNDDRPKLDHRHQATSKQSF